MDVLQVIQTIALAVIPFTGAWITSRLRKPKDFERAEQIKTIAQSLAALVVINNPDKPAAALLKLVIEALAGQVPTGNRAVLERAAADGLRAAGVTLS